MTRRPRSHHVLALALALPLAILGPASADEASVSLGLALPLSGPDIAFGEEVRVGAEKAVADINANGGIQNHPIRLVIGDDGSDPKKAESVARRFVGLGLKMVIGPISSASVLPASAIYGAANVLELVPAATAPAVTERGWDKVFRLGPRDDQQPLVAARFLIERHYASIAILHDRSSAGKGFADAVRAALVAKGLHESFYGSLPPEPRDLTPLVGRIRAAGAQIVVWGGGAAGAALLVRQIHDARLPLLGSAALGGDDFLQTAGNAGDGTFVVFAADPRDRPAAEALRHRLADEGTEPYLFTFHGYAAVEILKAAADRTQSLEPARLAASLRDGPPIETVIGPMTFDRKGDPTTDSFAVHMWRRLPSGRMILTPSTDS